MILMVKDPYSGLYSIILVYRRTYKHDVHFLLNKYFLYDNQDLNSLKHKSTSEKCRIKLHQEIDFCLF